MFGIVTEPGVQRQARSFAQAGGSLGIAVVSERMVLEEEQRSGFVLSEMDRRPSPR
ncbi:MAG: hypothetical protein HY814_09970 [Candidatus Riflebacteria bacterium]|nr:hypothetical protein [Candidatus Riflebacteria bacterium]